MAHQLFEVREVFAKPVEREALFEEPCVRDERAGLSEVFAPHFIDIIEVNAEFQLNFSWRRVWLRVVLLECFSESVNALVVLVFERRFSQARQDVLRFVEEVFF